MGFYCLCQASNNKPDSQHFGAPNRYCAFGQDEEIDALGFPPLALRRKMECIKTGAAQVILDTDQDRPNTWGDAARPDRYRRHYPNVDVFECPVCHARITRE